MGMKYSVPENTFITGTDSPICDPMLLPVRPDAARSVVSRHLQRISTGYWVDCSLPRSQHFIIPPQKNSKGSHQNSLGKYMKIACSRPKTKIPRVFLRASATLHGRSPQHQSQAHHSSPLSPLPEAGTTRLLRICVSHREQSLRTTQDPRRCQTAGFPPIFPPALLPRGSARSNK